MTLLTSAELVAGVTLVGCVWSMNQYLISSGMLKRAMSVFLEERDADELFLGLDTNRNLLVGQASLEEGNRNQATGAWDDTTIMVQRQTLHVQRDEQEEVYRQRQVQLALTYEAIYEPTEQCFESQAAQTWLWLILALLLNLVWIRIELGLLQDMVTPYDDIQT